MNALITGGAGFIGSHIADRLLNDGHNVIIIDNLSTGKKSNLEKHTNNPNLIFFDRNICEDLNQIFESKKINVVFHLAGIINVQYSIENPKETHDVNVNGTLNLLENCKKHNIDRVIFSSSASVYGDTESLPLKENLPYAPLSPYATHKAICEQYMNLYNAIYNTKTINLRYFNAYGPRQNGEGAYANVIAKFTKIILENQIPTIYGDGTNTRDYVFISDIVEANIKASKTSNPKCFGKTINIGTGKRTSVNEITQKILKKLNFNTKPTHGPKVIEQKTSQADISLAKQLLDWEPKISFEEGLQKTLEYYLETSKKTIAVNKFS